MSAPSVGDLIRHTCSIHGEIAGVVRSVLSSQFVYITEDGNARFCLFNEKWDRLKTGQEVPEEKASVQSSEASRPVEGKRRKRQTTIQETSPSVPAQPTDSLLEMDMAALVNDAMKEEPPAEKPSPLPGETILAYMKRIKQVAQ